MSIKVKQEKHLNFCSQVQGCACVLNRFSHVRFFATLWTVACQAPLSMEFSRQEYWSGLPCPPPGDLPKPGIEPASLTSPSLAGGFFTTSDMWEAQFKNTGGKNRSERILSPLLKSYMSDSSRMN